MAQHHLAPLRTGIAVHLHTLIGPSVLGASSLVLTLYEDTICVLLDLQVVLRRVQQVLDALAVNLHHCQRNLQVPRAQELSRC